MESRIEQNTEQIWYVRKDANGQSLVVHLRMCLSITYGAMALDGTERISDQSNPTEIFGHRV